MSTNRKLCTMSMAATLCCVGLAAPGHAQERMVVDLSLKGAGARAHFDTVRVHRGDEVVLRLSADAPMDLHLHGYNMTARARPNEPAEFRFVATTPGRFSMEAHTAEGHRRLGYIEVHPR